MRTRRCGSRAPTGRRSRLPPPPRSCEATSGREGSTGTPSRPCSARPDIASPGAAEGPAGLTPREVDVLRLLARGLSNKEIGARLVISPKTAGSHIEHIYAKIDASSRAAASLYAVQHGLLPEDDVTADVVS